MSKKKDITELEDYPLYYVDIMSMMEKNNISKNSLCRMTGIAYNALQRYCKSEIKRVDLDVISRICCALNCDISDIIKKDGDY
ncbi:helix-turn-helix transcriptional regulator [[Clostridium] symbiosum]|uniref:helix-turn-helix domain-containing protein n=1 Tax=Clostridium symbiosum TaxID=1512 RepID=UPI001D063FA8|nr:helix-turn-helix transcriptional regulator [[Clostridium] symbiosum]MCB6608452.1 helix-turn-helix transcriptional regulator [[Clostridium] symbiosum]MCB6930666.1 helix-turn-helix transcriptional regulator [[Clostridium] symbiosum]